MIIQSDWADLRNCPIDIFELEMKVRDFYLILNDYEDIMERIFEAKHILESARIIVANLIDPQNNEYIFAYIESYDWMIDNIGRIDRFFDEMEEKALTRREMSISIKPEDYPKESFTIVNYIRKLDVIMQHLVYYPIKKAYIKFQQPFFIGGKEVEKDERLFCYFVFVELFKSSQSLGNIMYEKKKQIQPSYESPTQDNTPKEIPKNVDTKKTDYKIYDFVDEFENNLDINQLESKT